MEKSNSPVSVPCGIAAAVCSVFLAAVTLCFFRAPLFLLLPAAAGLFLLLRQISQVHNRRLFVCNAVFSLLLAISFIAGNKANLQSGQTMSSFLHNDLLPLAALGAVFFICFSCMSDFIGRHPVHLCRKRRRLSPGKMWLASTLVLFFSWIPCLFVFYPGNISGDSVACIVRALGKVPLSNQQPLLYILLIRPVLQFAFAIGRDINFGAALFLTLQTAVMAVVIGYFFCWLTQKGAAPWIQILCMAYFVLNPVFSIYAVTMWKDILFSAFTLLYLLQLYNILQSGGEKLQSLGYLVGFVLLNILLCFLRNNGYYLVFVTLVILAVLYRKYWKRVLPAFLAVLILVPVIQGPGYKAANVAASPFAESVGIPLQQIGYTVANDGAVTVEQKAFLNQILPLDTMKKSYRPYIVNPIKFNSAFNNNFLESHKGEFIKVWAQMLRPNWKKYVKAYLMETVGYWHIGTANWIALYGAVDPEMCRMVGIVQPDAVSFAWSRGAVKNSLDCLQKQIPVLSLILSIGFLFWAVLYAAFQMIIQKRRKKLLLLVPLLLLWLTLMVATPTFCEFRYMFAFSVAFPLVVLLSFPVEQREKMNSPRHLKTE
ncbi:DUF6020 family protein [Caproicibacterium sp. XB2]|jgi:hypothetical protein|uniref:DUF6020 family protein n=1 Tax=Caproicibacterium TaxID=2834348 RepID=UPI00384CEA96